MQLRHFRYFIAVAEEGSFVRAARRLHVAQPSLSRQIHDLEGEVGAPLFERWARGVRLTEAGAAFLGEARRAVEAAARAVVNARTADRSTRTRLHLGHGPLSFLSPVVANLVGAFRTAHPDDHIALHHMKEVDQPTAIREHRIDVGVTFAGAPRVDGFNTHLLFGTPATGVVLPSSHPLAAKSEVSLPELRDLTYIHINPKVSPQIYDVVLAALSARGLVPARKRPRPRDHAGVTVRIAAGDSWMLAADGIGQRFTEGNQAVVYRPFIEPPIPVWLALIWRLDNPSPLVDQLVEVARSIGMDVRAEELTV